MRRYSDSVINAAALEVHSRYAYDGAGKISSITHAKSEIAVGQAWNGTATLPASISPTQTIAAYHLSYDRDNRLVAFASYADRFRTAYSYDATDQLTAATSSTIVGLAAPSPLPATESYNLDLNGNRRTSGGVSQSASGTHNRLQTDGTFNYTYDNEGNTLTKTRIATGAVTQFSWDHRNRLTAVRERAGATAVVNKETIYAYDVFDRKTLDRFDSDGLSGSNRDEVWVNDGQHPLLQYRDSDGVGPAQPYRLANRYLHGAVIDQILADEQYANGTGPVISSIVASPTPGTTLWAVADHLGSVRDLVDNNGITRQHVVYDSFGRRLSEVDRDASGTVIASTSAAAVDTIFGYTGREWDKDTSLQYNRARWYDPATGRWLSEDPLGLGPDRNPYRYVRNQPTTLTDPSGLEPPALQAYNGPWIGADSNPTPWWQVPFVRDPRSSNELRSPGMYHWVAGNLYWRLGARDAVEGVKAVCNDPLGSAYNATIGLPSNISSLIIHWDEVPDLDKQDLPAKIATGIVTGNIGGTPAGMLPLKVSRTGYKFRVLSREGSVLEIVGDGPEGSLYTIPEVINQGDTVCLRGFDIDGPGAGAFSRYELKLLVRDLVEQLGHKPSMIRIEGNPRTTGANPGKQPRPITIPME
jgi:RHS repeat-associated protein